MQKTLQENEACAPPGPQSANSHCAAGSVLRGRETGQDTQRGVREGVFCQVDRIPCQREQLDRGTATLFR